MCADEGNWQTDDDNDGLGDFLADELAETRFGYWLALAATAFAGLWVVVA